MADPDGGPPPASMDGAGRGWGPRLGEEAGLGPRREESIIEAVLMVAEEPVAVPVLAEIIERSPAEIEALCDSLADDYETAGRGFVLRRVAGGVRLQSHPDLFHYVERFVRHDQASRLSPAALETLAIVAYKQPVSRAQVAAIRGVNADAVMRTLEQRGYVSEVARDPGPGRAVLYGTSREFLERLGLGSLDDLPPLGDFVPGSDVMEALESGLTAHPPSHPPPREPAPREATP
jgi:segregation and condensation protein B